MCVFHSLFFSLKNVIHKLNKQHTRPVHHHHQWVNRRSVLSSPSRLAHLISSLTGQSMPISSLLLFRVSLEITILKLMVVVRVIESWYWNLLRNDSKLVCVESLKSRHDFGTVLRFWHRDTILSPFLRQNGMLVLEENRNTILSHHVTISGLGWSYLGSYASILTRFWQLQSTI